MSNPIKDGLTVNEVEVSGRVITAKNKEDGTSMITVISSYGKDVFPRFVCPKGVLPKLSHHARVKINGHITTFMVKDGNDLVPIQRFVADSIVPEVTLVENKFGIKGKFFPDMNARVYLKGRIKGIRLDNGWYRYTIEVAGDGRPYYVRVSMKELERHPELKKDDEVCCVCGISTNKKKIGGEEKYYEDIIISDISKNE